MTTPINVKELQEHINSRVSLPKELDGLRHYLVHIYQTHAMMLRLFEKLSAQLIDLDTKISRLKVEAIQKIEIVREETNQKFQKLSATTADNKGDPKE